MKVAAGIDVSDLEEQINELAAELWELSKEELKDIIKSLEEMRQPMQNAKGKRQKRELE